MKAWHVQDTQGERQEIIFAETRGKAITQSEAYSWDGEYTEVRATRAEYADGLEGDYEQLLQAKLDNCWWIECSDCNYPVTEDDDYEIKHQAVFCKKCSKALESGSDE